MHTWVLVIAREGLCTALTAQGAPECVWGEKDIVKGRLGLDIGKNFSTEKAVSHWKGLLRELVESPLLEVFKGCLDVTLSALVW